jgi:hypothetical protein
LKVRFEVGDLKDLELGATIPNPVVVEMDSVPRKGDLVIIPLDPPEFYKGFHTVHLRVRAVIWCPYHVNSDFNVWIELEMPL